jgi:hypothetical protein
LKKHLDNRQIAEAAGSAAVVLVDAGAPLYADSHEVLKWLNENETLWKGRNYTDYSADRLQKLLAKYRRDGNIGDIREAISQAWFHFIESNDARRAAPLIMRFVTQANLKSEYERAILSESLWGLQLYAGPLDFANTKAPVGTVEEMQKAQQNAIAWWQENKEKAPVYWLLNSLANRKYDTGNPQNVKATAKALLDALASNDPLEAYAAGVIIAHALPDGDRVVVERNSLVSRPAPDVKLTYAQEVARDYLKHLLISRAYHWCIFESREYVWDHDEGKYERLRDRKNSVRGDSSN